MFHEDECDCGSMKPVQDYFDMFQCESHDKLPININTVQLMNPVLSAQCGAQNR